MTSTSPSRFIRSLMMSGAPLTLGQVSRSSPGQAAIIRLALMAQQGPARSPARGGAASLAAAPDGTKTLTSSKPVQAAIIHQGQVMALAQAGR